MIRIDTNYIIRYLVNDNIKMADIAEEILTTNQLLCLINFENISVSNYEIIKKALNIFKNKNLDFVDCLLCAYSNKDEIVTFDKRLNKCIENI